LLSNSTCPLCRCALGNDNASAALLDALGGDGGWKHEHAALSVRLGKLKSIFVLAPDPAHDGADIVTR
jgi:hypothetical protein